MRQYKVIALSVGSGRGKRIYKSGDIVTESSFRPGIAEELVLKGFLERIGEGEVKNISLEKTIHGDHEKDVTDWLNADNLKDVENANIENLESGKDDNDDVDSADDLSKRIADTLKENKGTSIPGIEDITKNAIIENLKAGKIEFDYKASKEELYNLWVDNFKG